MPNDELIGRLEAASEMTLELFLEVQTAIRPDISEEDWSLTYAMLMVNAYESAALTLVPEGCLAVFHLFNHRDNFWECDLGDTGPDYRGEAATPALAIVIAALRATERGEAGR